MTHPTTSSSRTTPRTRCSRAIGLALAIVAIPASAPLLACDTGQFAAGTTVGVMRRAAPGVSRMRDPDILEAAFPAGIQQMEGLLEINPNDMTLRGMMGRSYASFGYAFLEDHYEVAQDSTDATEEDIEHWRERATAAYVRGREIAMEGLDTIHPEGGGLMAAHAQGLEPFVAHLARFDNAERDAPLLFWVAYNWVRYISLHRDDMDAIADLAFVTALAERVYQLDPTYMDHAPVALRGGLMAAAPPSLGGRPEDAKVEIERAIALTERKNLNYLVTEAQIVAVPLQDRELYRALLQEVIDFDVDSFPEQRIPNMLAQRRARRYLARIDDLFMPVDEPMDEPEGDAPEGDAPAEGADAAEPDPSATSEEAPSSPST
ncbi:MAG: TRAP transporter TatT component family protein [Myxococcota bacterium]|nr:TRAP transporter TatT component family protein [Myxococcota bacterium]